MKRFFKRVQEKAADVAQPPVLTIALGDSVTQGAMEHQMFSSKDVYHRLVQEQLEHFFPTTTFSTINAGVAGDNACGGLNRLERDVLRHDPDLVLIAFGLNDCLGGMESLQGFESSLKEIVAHIRWKTQADIVLLTPPFMARRKNSRVHPDHECYVEGIIGAQNNGTLEAYANAIRCVATSAQTRLADVHREWCRLNNGGLDTDDLLIDGLHHPDPRGHRIMAAIVFNAIISNYFTPSV